MDFVHPQYVSLSVPSFASPRLSRCKQHDRSWQIMAWVFGTWTPKRPVASRAKRAVLSRDDAKEKQSKQQTSD